MPSRPVSGHWSCLQAFKSPELLSPDATNAVEGSAGLVGRTFSSGMWMCTEIQESGL